MRINQSTLPYMVMLKEGRVGEARLGCNWCHRLLFRRKALGEAKFAADLCPILKDGTDLGRGTGLDRGRDLKINDEP